MEANPRPDEAFDLVRPPAGLRLFERAETVFGAFFLDLPPCRSRFGLAPLGIGCVPPLFRCFHRLLVLS